MFRKKLDRTSQKESSWGHENECKAYIVGIPTGEGNFKIIKTRNVESDENQMFFGAKLDESPFESNENSSVDELTARLDTSVAQSPDMPEIVETTEIVKDNNKENVIRSGRIRNPVVRYGFDEALMVNESDSKDPVVPLSAKEALKDEKWKQAMESEFIS